MVLDAFGPERTVFGSDRPVCPLRSSYAEVTAAAEDLTAELTADERAQVSDGTAARFRPTEDVRSEPPYTPRHSRSIIERAVNRLKQQRLCTPEPDELQPPPGGADGSP